MFKFLSTHKKHVAAVFSAMLMLAWVAAPGKGMGQDSGPDREYGRVGNQVLHQSDVVAAKAELDAMNRYIVMPAGTDQSGEPRSVPITVLLLGGGNPATQKADLFALLKAEAVSAGIRVEQAAVVQIMQKYTGPADKPDEEAAARQGVIDLLLIRERYNQWQSALRISTPMVDHSLAVFGQQPSLDVIQIRADQYTPRVAPPTTQQVQTQFDTFKGYLAGQSVAESNPYGFGYKFPTRAKLQWIKVRKADIDKAVAATKSDYDWDVVARKYYKRFESEFADSKNPGTIKPYSTVVNDAIKSVRQEPTDELVKQVTTYLSASLDSQWRAHDESTNVHSPTTAPAAFTDLSNFTAAAAGLGQNPATKVFAFPGETSYLSQDQLLGDASIGVLPGQADTKYGRELKRVFADLLAAHERAADPDSAAAMSALMRPSPVMTTPAGDLVVIRVISVLPTVVPPSVDAVRPQVESDLKQKAGYELARAEADRLVGAAKSGTLPAVAAAEHQAVVAIDSVGRVVNADYLPYIDPLKPLEPTSVPWRNDFLDQTFKALSLITPTDEHPAVVVTKPSEFRLFVVQIKSLRPVWTKENYYLTAIQDRSDLMNQLDQEAGFRASYFDPKAIADRIGFKAAGDTGK